MEFLSDEHRATLIGLKRDRDGGILEEEEHREERANIIKMARQAFEGEDCCIQHSAACCGVISIAFLNIVHTRILPNPL